MDKRTSFLDVLRRERVDIALVSESHLLQKDVHKLQNKHYVVKTNASALNKTKGVVIVVRRNFQVTNLGVGGDSDGRITFMKTIIENKKIAFLSIYAPNSFDPDFYVRLSNIMHDLSDYRLFIGADFNAVWDHSVDRTAVVEGSDQRSASVALRKWAQEFSVIDIWRVTNHNKQDFSFFSARHHSFSRIDFIFVSKDLLEKVSTDMIPLAFSDHKAVICRANLSVSRDRAPRWRFNTSLLRNESFLVQLESGLAEFISFNLHSVEDTRILWDSVKGYIRSNCISFSSNLNKTRQRRILELEGDLGQLEGTMHNNVTPDSITQRNKIKEELNSLSRQHAEFLIHRTRQHHYFEGARPSRSLALSLRASENFAHIPAIKTPAGALVTDPKLINETFRSFYSNLYSSEVPHDSSKFDLFFKNLNLTKLLPHEATSLDKPFTLLELERALRSLNKGKSAGFDGIPPELYLQCWSQLGPLLLNMINHAISSGSFSRDVNTATITLLHKKGKDPNECANYRPISLLNADVKLFAKVLALRLEPLMNKLIHPDQTGFVKSRLSSDNVRRLLHIVEASAEVQTPCAVLSLDAEKAFDRLEWHYLWAVLQHMGFGIHFINMIKTLYASPSAMVMTGNICSSLFPVGRSSRQGCVLSPLLFILSLEPLAQTVRQSTHTPVIVHGTDHFISLYCDDILLYLGDAIKSTPHILSIFDKFGSISGYKINWSKSALLPLNDTMRHASLPNIIPVVDNFKYLGLSIFPSLQTTVSVNYNSTLRQVESDLERWSSIPNSFRARASIVKMNILPRVNFCSSMLPLAPPVGHWDKLHTFVSRYVWKGKRPRIKMSILQRHKLSGGLGLPNFQFYFWSSTLRSLHTWLDPEAQVAWRSLEEHLVIPHRLQDVIYSNIPLKMCKSKFGSLISHLVAIWRTVESHSSNHFKFHPHLPLFNNFALCLGGHPMSFPQWRDKGINTLSDIMSDNALRSFQDLKSHYNLPGTSFFFYLQLRSALRAYGVPWGENMVPHPIHKICGSSSTKGLVSALYTFMSKHAEKPLQVDSRWSHDLSIAPSSINLSIVWSKLDLSSRNPNHQMIHYNFIHRLYCTPHKLFLMKLNPSPNCQLCSLGTIGTFVHMVWECPGVSDFWSMVSNRMSIVLGRTIPCSPTILLLRDFTGLDLSLMHQRWFLVGLTAAKKLVAQRWKAPHDLSYQHWVNTVIDLAKLERSVASMHGAQARNINLWSTFINNMLGG